METKRCTRCSKHYPATREFFNRANWIASGLRSDCKTCYRASQKRGYMDRLASEQTLRTRKQRDAMARGQRICKVCCKESPATLEHFTKVSTGHFDTTCRPCARLRTRAWAKRNSDRYKAQAAARWARRYCEKKRRMPKWLSKEHRQQIDDIYARCRLMNAGRPRAFHVDHIVPLVGRSVSGLHVPWNLQILPGTINARKSNKWNC